jgi:hypothetical protein
LWKVLNRRFRRAVASFYGFAVSATASICKLLAWRPCAG